MNELPHVFDAPGPRGLPIIGCLPAMARNLSGFWPGVAGHGDIATYRAGSENFCLISNRSHIAEIYQADNQRYFKRNDYQLMQSVMGNGLLIANGPRWQRQRRLLQSLFTKKHVANWLDIVTACTVNMLHQWTEKTKDGGTLDMTAEMMGLIQQIIVKIMFGRSTDYHVSSKIVNDMAIINDGLLKQVLIRTLFSAYLPRFQPPQFPRFRRAVVKLRHTLDKNLTEGKRRGDQDGDTISAYLKEKNAISQQEVCDELITFFLAGHETTACVLAWTLYYLTEFPEIAERAYQETTRGASDPPAVDDIEQISYLQQVIDETMRLNPPVYGVTRTAAVDHTLGNYRMTANSKLVLSPYVMHRHPNDWEEPEQFDPGRFSSARSKTRQRYSYFPFGGGPRSCISIHLASMELAVILAMILRRFRLIAAPDRQVVAKHYITLHPHGVKVRLEKRTRQSQ